MQVAKQRAETVEPGRDARVDDHAADMFKDLGFPAPLPDGLAETYNKFKKVKDAIRRGPLSPEGYAAVIMLFRHKYPKG